MVSIKTKEEIEKMKKAGHVKMVFLRGGQQDRSSTIIILLKKCIRF